MATIKYKDTGGVWQTAGTPTSLYTYSYDGTNQIHILTGSGTFGQVELLTQYVSSTDTITVNSTTVTGIYLGGLIAQTLRPSFYSFIYDGSNLYFQTSAIYNSLDQTSSGFALDARQGKTLNDAMTTRGIPSGGTTGQALIKTSATDYVTEWAAVGRVSPNLLDNWDFAAPVNSYGVPSGSPIAYAYTPVFPCWKANGTLTWTQGVGITLAAGGDKFFSYREIKYTKLLGKKVTISAKLGDGTFVKATLTFPASVSGVSVLSDAVMPSVGFASVGFEYRAGGVAICGLTENYVPLIQVQTSTADVTIAELYCELGEASTHPHAPPMDYVQEFQRCQRYYQVLELTGGSGVHDGGGAYFAVTFFLPSVMRITPSIATGGAYSTFVYNNSFIQNVALTSVTSHNSGKLYLRFNGNTPSGYYLVASAIPANTVGLSAEL